MSHYPFHALNTEFAVSEKNYVILTAAHHVETGAIGGNVGSETKLWLASL